MFKRISFLSVLLYGLTLAAASNGSDVISNLDARDTTNTKNQRPVAGFIMKTWPAIIGIVLYGLSGAIHWIHFFRIGQRYMLTLTIGMTCFTFGLIMRVVDSHSPYSLGIYIVEDFFVLLSPCAFLATEYMLLSRLATSLGQDIADDCLLIPARRITKLFVWSDVITFWIQASGGGLSVNQKLSSVGTKIAMVGLILQLVSFALFTIMLIAFGFRVRAKYPSTWNIRASSRTSESLTSVVGPFKISSISNWKILYFTMCLTCIGVLIRCVFRIAEFAGGYFGFLATHEGYFYLLDALPLWIAMTLYCFVWPSRFINRPEADFTASRGTVVGVPLIEQGKNQEVMYHIVDRIDLLLASFHREDTVENH
ncbi:RTA1-domain-containing protein [Gymnopus androsaceus JB14]|uniref:RTA1-domain-containing protein n=1 Tax=Gymnopus androsaceus JB14 TaxID=1447944 RepID=A0A6A4HCY9_9AGAR|nr:RTA1-domain-containing protein [Gymnopus androsaceus JB14]